ncbi:Carotenoid oxygenase domain containing protein [Aphelenchoides fujianensis]|nr:Carotenoid oxygenase domain containing protein [Aphelenchoides fujianensis]
MTEIGRAYVPISIPFGFHNRFFSKRELGMPEGFQAGIYGASESRREKFLKVTTAPPSTSAENTFWARLIKTTQAIIETQTQQPTWIPISPLPSESTEGGYPTRTGATTASRLPGVYPSQRPSPSLPPYTSIRPSELPTEETESPRPRLATGVTGPYGVLPSVVGRPSSNRGTPNVPGVRTVTMRPPSLTTRYVPMATTERPDPGATVRQLYEHTLKAFCHWLTRVFKSLNYESCVENGHRAIRGYLNTKAKAKA